MDITCPFNCLTVTTGTGCMFGLSFVVYLFEDVVSLKASNKYTTNDYSSSSNTIERTNASLSHTVLINEMSFLGDIF